MVVLSLIRNSILSSQTLLTLFQLLHRPFPPRCMMRYWMGRVLSLSMRLVFEVFEVMFRLLLELRGWCRVDDGIERWAEARPM